MRLLVASISLFLFLLTGCTGPTPGGACSTTDQVTCKSATEAWACVSGHWAPAPCAGPRGCTDATVFDCDLALATPQTVCPPWADGRLACSNAPASVVNCFGGVWGVAQSCSGGCSNTTGTPQCTASNTGGGTGTGGGMNTGGGTGTGGGMNTGGAMNTGGGVNTGGGMGGSGGGSVGSCDPTTCSGCCSNGQCIGAPLNSSANFCGTGGVTCDDCGSRGQRCDNSVCSVAVSCNLTTCPDGCCSNGQCINAPLNSSTNFCGSNGNACSDCGRNGLICRAATFTCELANTGGGGGSTGGGGGSGGGTSDPCQGVPIGGECLNTSLVRFCSIPTGTGTPSVQTYQCTGGTSCQSTGMGAACVQTGTCTQGDTRCGSSTAQQTCNSNGSWGAATSCGTGGACIATPFGGQCITTTIPTNAVSHTLLYETRAPKADFTDWGPITTAPARNVVVISMRSQTIIDATVTSSTGTFTLKVPSSPTSSDAVLFYAYGGDGLGIRFAVGDPNLGTGTFSPGDRGSTPRYWSWSKAASALTNGATTTITKAQGSGALNIFDLLQSIWASSVSNNQGRQGLTIGMWFGIGTEWSCGACFSQDDIFASGIWMPGDSTDEGYWSDYTIAHELGHWQMASYGTSPNEGGTHYIMCPTFPGQAWSEGYATWHSAAVRNQPVLEDKQQGTFFWLNIASRTYYPGSTSPQAMNGLSGTNLLGNIDENAVSALLWGISSARSTGVREIFHAISSQHLNTAPWPRGYSRRTWSVGNSCAQTNVVNTGQPSLFLADAMDALSCGGNPAQSNRMPASTILASCSTAPSTTNGAYFPYPTTSPICRSNFCYGCKSGATCSAGNTTTACGTGGNACVQCGSGQSCTNGVCQ